MSYQEPDERRRAADYIERADPQVGWMPVILGVAFVAVLGFLIFGTSGPQTDRPTTSQRTEMPNTAPSAPPSPTPAPPTPQ
jgi:hypothetical protein